MLSEQYLNNKNSFVKGALIGWKSNRKAKKSGDYSSLVYVFKNNTDI